MTHKMLECVNYFDKLEVPILLNTSFNRSGDPIVETPQDALDSYLKMDIDYLVIGNYLISKWN